MKQDIMNEFTKTVLESGAVTTNKINTYVDMQSTTIKEFCGQNQSKFLEENEISKD